VPLILILRENQILVPIFFWRSPGVQLRRGWPAMSSPFKIDEALGGNWGYPWGQG